MTTKDLLKKIAPMAIALIILLVVAFSCSAMTGNDETANISDPNGIFVELGDIEVTNEEVYERVVNQFGSNELRQYIDTELLSNGSKDYIALAKSDADFNADEYVEMGTYNGYTYEKAVTLFTEEQLETLQADFEEKLIYNGFDSIEAYKETLYLEHARSLYTKDQLIAEDAVLVSDVVYEYENMYYNDACVIGIRTTTLQEARDLLLAEGISTEEDGSFSEEYTNSEVLVAYINIYNKVYADRVPLTLASAQNCSNEDILVNFETLSEDQPELANFIFMILDTENTVEPTTGLEYLAYTSPIEINTGSAGYYMAYKVSGDNLNVMSDLLGITVEEYTEIAANPASSLTSSATLDELIENVLEDRSNTSSIITEQMNELYEEHELTIYDQYLRYNFELVYGETVEADSSNKLVFSFLDGSNNLVEVTPDDFFPMLEDHVAAVSINLLNGKLATSNEELYNEVVTDELKDEMLVEIETHKANFLSEAYAQYGFSSSTMTWDEFIYAAFQFRSEQELYTAMLEGAVVEEYRIDMNTGEEIQEVYYDLMAEEYENAFSLEVKHFLIYVDNNEDGHPDLNENYVWSAEQTQLANELADKLREILIGANETEEINIDSLQAMEATYNAASFETDENEENYSEWAKFKAAGLKIKVEDLDVVNNGTMVEPFNTELREMYDEMIADGLFNKISENNVATEYGYHLIYADEAIEKGDAYPDDDSLEYPSRLDIEAFNAGLFDEVSTETLIFIAQYYTPVTTEYTENYELVLFDEARAAVGTVSFTDSRFNADYDEIVAVNLASAERN